jgi:hypothetical protein
MLCDSMEGTLLTCRFPNLILDSCQLALTARLASSPNIVFYDTTESYFRLTANDAVSLTAGIPRDTRISGAYPNPFNSETRIEFTLARPEAVRLALYNLVGQKVRTLETGTFAEGEHTIMWDGLTDAHTQAGTGLYLCRLETSGSVDTRRILLMR